VACKLMTSIEGGADPTKLSDLRVRLRNSLDTVRPLPAFLARLNLSFHECYPYERCVCIACLVSVSVFCLTQLYEYYSSTSCCFSPCLEKQWSDIDPPIVKAASLQAKIDRTLITFYTSTYVLGLIFCCSANLHNGCSFYIKSTYIAFTESFSSSKTIE